MTAQRYQAIFDWFRARPAALRALDIVRRALVEADEVMLVE